MITRKKSLLWFGAIALLVAAPLIAVQQNASAATLSQVVVRFDRMQTSQGTTGTVCAKPATTATEASVQVVFPTGYTVSTTTSNWTVNTTNVAWPSGAVAWPTINTATAAAGQTVTFPSGDLTVGTLYCFNWTNTAAVSVSSSANNSNTGTVTTRDSVPATIDTGTYATASVTGDQITVTATVPQSFSFALSGTSDALSTLSTSSVTSSPTPRTVTVNTNAKNGWHVWAKDANAGLTSASASKTIAATAGNNTITTAAEGYNTGVTSSQSSGSGTITVDSVFVGGSSGRGGGLATTLATIASSNGTASNAVLTLTNNVTIIGTTPAATDYTDTITIVGAGLF